MWWNTYTEKIVRIFLKFTKNVSKNSKILFQKLKKNFKDIFENFLNVFDLKKSFMKLFWWISKLFNEISENLEDIMKEFYREDGKYFVKVSQERLKNSKLRFFKWNFGEFPGLLRR